MQEFQTFSLIPNILSKNFIAMSTESSVSYIRTHYSEFWAEIILIILMWLLWH